MDDFDRRLEIELANMLDPIVDAPAPRRRRPTVLRVFSGGLSGLPAEIVVVAEPVPAVVTVGAPS